MANRLSKEKAQAIAAEYCTNGFEKVKALLTMGYAKSYANSKRGLRLYDNSMVKQAVCRIQALTIAKTGYTVEQAQAEYEEARQLAMAVRQPAAAASAITGKARLYGFDKDNAIGEKTVIVIGPRIVETGSPKPIDSKEIANV